MLCCNSFFVKEAVLKTSLPIAKSFEKYISCLFAVKIKLSLKSLVQAQSKLPILTKALAPTYVDLKTFVSLTCGDNFIKLVVFL